MKDLTVKDKAKKLVDSFTPYAHYYVHDLVNMEDNKIEQWENAKQCAIIAVDEIIKALESDWSFMKIKINYWQDVKQEIEKL